MLTFFSRIVVPYDGSELSKKALETAIRLAKQDEGTELNVITVVDQPTNMAFYATYNLDTLREANLSAAKEMLDEVEQKLKNLPNKTGTFILEGSPAYEIVDFIKQDDADLVVMGSRGLSGLKELFLGSVSHYVVQKVTCQVFIVK
ncbi:universal stress protein (plasmid) [Bacillus sp. F19]|nr:universal stress protein [Bacillus sp. F19]